MTERLNIQTAECMNNPLKKEIIMKRLKLIVLLLLAVVSVAALSSCKETNADRLEKMRGDWEIGRAHV